MKLNAKERNDLPDSDFALPGRRYPVDTKNRAANAKARASEFASPSQEAQIDRKADKVLGKSDSNADDKPKHSKKHKAVMKALSTMPMGFGT